MNFRMLENVSEWLKMVVSCSICRYYSAYRSAYSASFLPILPCSSPFSSAPTCSPLPLPIPPCLHPFHLVPPRSPSPYPFCLFPTHFPFPALLFPPTAPHRQYQLCMSADRMIYSPVISFAALFLCM